MIRSVLIDLLASKQLHQSLKSLFSPCEIHDEYERNGISHRKVVSKSQNNISNENEAKDRGEFLQDHACSITCTLVESDNEHANLQGKNEAECKTKVHGLASDLNYLGSNETVTPAVTFSPFLNFSDDRSSRDDSNSSINDQHLVLMYDSKNDTFCPDSNDSKTSFTNILLLSRSDANVLRPVIKNRQTSTAQVRGAESMCKQGSKKRKASHTCLTNRLDRLPQKRFSLESSILGDELELFGSRKDGRIRLTTNIPRQVESVNPVTKERIRLFTSCSEAARVMDINRTRMSRTCRSGGGVIGEYLYKYVEIPKNPHGPLDQNVVTAASALLLL